MAPEPIDKKAVLAEHFLLAQLRPEELERLAASATLTHHPAQATIFEKGDPGRGMMAVIRGRVKICSYSMGGKELVLNQPPWNSGLSTILDDDKLATAAQLLGELAERRVCLGAEAIDYPP